MKLNKRHREWAWAILVIAVVVGAVWWYGSMAPMYPSSTMTNSFPVSSATHSGNTSGGTVISKPDMTIGGVLATLPEASTFHSYFVASGVTGSLKGSYTLFVPTNSAFAALPPGTVSGLSAAGQKRVVEYHVVAGKILDADAVKSGTYTALSKDVLNFNVDLQTKDVYVNSGKVVAQYKASNGIIYVINSVLLPPKGGVY